MCKGKKPAGVYVHIPFCSSKCPYCDFFSRKGNESLYDKYTAVLMEKIRSSGFSLQADTVYFGGGTPGLIGAERLVRILRCIRESFGDISGELTAEVNPSKEDIDYGLMISGGINRLSVGLQSANDRELRLLGRNHDSAAAKKAIRSARAAGFENISLDLMLALPGQTRDELRRSVDFCAENNAKHISAYMLQIEEGTYFYRHRKEMDFPGEEESAEIYEYLCGLMEEYGYEHYEISNFCRPGFEGKHNLKYWRDEEYIGFGPSAHSFIDGKRFCTPGNMKAFEEGEQVSQGTGGDEEEFLMLGLRLSEGISRSRFRERFGKELPPGFVERARQLQRHGLTRVTEDGVSLTRKGFLVSNDLIAELLLENV